MADLNSIQKQLEAMFLEASRRREIDAAQEAHIHGISLEHSRNIIRKLLKAKLIYAANRSKPNYWGSASTGYRAI